MDYLSSLSLAPVVAGLLFGHAVWRCTQPGQSPGRLEVSLYFIVFLATIAITLSNLDAVDFAKGSVTARLLYLAFTGYLSSRWIMSWKNRSLMCNLSFLIISFFSFFTFIIL